jgi:hypothetical protein
MALRLIRQCWRIELLLSLTGPIAILTHGFPALKRWAIVINSSNQRAGAFVAGGSNRTTVSSGRA